MTIHEMRVCPTVYLNELGPTTENLRLCTTIVVELGASKSLSDTCICLCITYFVKEIMKRDKEQELIPYIDE